jgi:hypothetical protein
MASDFRSIPGRSLCDDEPPCGEQHRINHIEVIAHLSKNMRRGYPGGKHCRVRSSRRATARTGTDTSTVRSEFHYSEAITYVHAYELPLRAVAGTCHSCGSANQGTRDVGGEDGTKKGREIEGREEEVMR